MITVWIGYDKQFADNIPVEVESISKHSANVKIRFLKLDHIKELTRPRDANQSTDSAFTRWMIPYLANYTGWHLYLDSDMMVCDSLDKLWELRDNSKAVMVVKHNKKHQEGLKFNNMPQVDYPRKNWSSVILFNADKCRMLTPDYVNQAHGLDLHQFKWLDDNLIGELPARWNHLVGVDELSNDPAIIHWTLGGPWFREYANVEHADKWNAV
jgi:lipopolysaccharide biosynthesis glycosyltransferase